MALFDFAPEVIAEATARGTLLKPGWYNVEIFSVDDEAKSKKGEDMTKVVFNCLDARDNDDNLVPGVKLFTQFMPLYPAFAINFVNALGANLGKEGKKGIKIDKSLIGKKLRVFVVRGMYEGKSNNQIEDYRPAV